MTWLVGLEQEKEKRGMKIEFHTDTFNTSFRSLNRVAMDVTIIS